MLTENPSLNSEKTVFIYGKPFTLSRSNGKPSLRRIVTQKPKQEKP
jgi:hypothetical protein